MIAGVNKNLPDRPPIHFRWLGAAGIELTYADEGLAGESLLASVQPRLVISGIGSERLCAEESLFTLSEMG